MKRLVCILFCILSVLAAASCTGSGSEELKFSKLEDFAGHNIATLTGSSLDVYVQEKYGKMNIYYFDEESIEIEAIKKGTVDAVLVSKPTGIITTARQPGLALFPEPFLEDNLALAFKKGNPLCQEFSAVIDRYAVDGTLDTLEQKWMYGDDSGKIISDELYNGPENPSKTLMFYCNDAIDPMSYIGDGGKIVGYDIELVLRIGLELGYKIQIVTAKFDSLLIALENESADFIGGSLSITEDRKKVADFTSVTYKGGLYALIREENLGVFKDIDLNSSSVTIATMIDIDVDVNDYYPNANVIYVKSESEGILALTSGQADGFVERSSYLKILKSTGVDNVHIHSDGQIGEIGYVAAAVSPNTGISDAKSKINSFIAEIQADGTLEKMEERWLIDKDYTMPDIPKAENPQYTIRVGTTGLAVPYSFIQNGELIGMEVELAERFAYWLGADIEFSEYDWDAIIVACATGKIDYAISNLYVTEEKAQEVIFSTPYSTYDLVIYVLDEGGAESEGFFEDIKDSFEKTFIVEGRWKLILQGLAVTVIISLGSAVLGIAVGSGICVLHRSENKLVRKITDGICYFISGIPALVVLMIVYFVIFAKSSISPIYSGIITFGILFGITFSTILSTAIESVDKTQWEAAKALGFDNKLTFFKVILPQTYRIILPLFKGEFVAMMKLTSIVGYIAIQDLTKAGDIIRARTFEAFFPLISVALVYFLLSALFIFILGRVEIKTDFNKRKSVYPNGINTCVEIKPVEKSGGGDIGEEIIRVEHLKKKYRNSTPLKDFNAVIRKGDVISIIGPSGTGKSTFLRMLNRLEQPDGGKIVVFGTDEDSKACDMNLIREKMGMVFQSFNLFNHLNVIENIMLAPCRLQKKSKQEAYENGMRLLRAVGLGEKALNMPSSLSGGQKQRVAIARALAMNPEIILFDEPTSALDPTMVGEVLDVIKGLAEQGLTMLIVTHEMKFARDVSNRIFYLDQGELYEEGTPDEIFDSPKRTRTHLFVNKLKSTAITVESGDYDYIAAEQTLRGFALKNRLSQQTTDNICKLFKTVLPHGNLIPEQSDEHKLHVVVEYNSDTDSASMKFIRECERYDVTADFGSDNLLIHSLCESVNYRYDEGKNILTLDKIV